MWTNGRFGNFEKNICISSEWTLTLLRWSGNNLSMQQQIICPRMVWVSQPKAEIPVSTPEMPSGCSVGQSVRTAWRGRGKNYQCMRISWDRGPAVLGSRHTWKVHALCASCCLHRKDHYLCLAEESRALLWVSDGLEPETQDEGLKDELQLPKPQSYPEQVSGWITGLVTELCWSEVAAEGMSVVTFVQLSPSLALRPFIFPSTDES